MYADWSSLCSGLASAIAKPGKATFTSAADAICQLLDGVSETRVSSHIDFILTLSDAERPVAVLEVADLLADLIALGHSESFLYGYGRSLFLPAAPVTEPVLDVHQRIQRLHALGRRREFSVSFKASAPAFIPHSDRVVAGKGVASLFTTLPVWEYLPGETGVLVKVSAPDYKAAIRWAADAFVEHVRSLSHSSALARVKGHFDQFKVKCHSDDSELVVSAGTLREYEPPPLIEGNAIWLCRQKTPAIAQRLEQARFWLLQAGVASGPAQFLDGWLALISLFESEDPVRIARLLARYRLLNKVHLLASWCADYLGKLAQIQPEALSKATIAALRLRRPLPERLMPLTQSAMAWDAHASAAAAAGPLIAARLREVNWLSSGERRLRLVEHSEREAQALLPWAKTLRHSVAHFGFASATSLDLANQWLLEDVANVFDQVAATALAGHHTAVATIHAEIDQAFENLLEATLQEPCLSVLHARQGVVHAEPAKRKSWHALRPRQERRQ
jgi:hypothetical protein